MKKNIIRRVNDIHEIDRTSGAIYLVPLRSLTPLNWRVFAFRHPQIHTRSTDGPGLWVGFGVRDLRYHKVVKTFCFTASTKYRLQEEVPVIVGMSRMGYQISHSDASTLPEPCMCEAEDSKNAYIARYEDILYEVEIGVEPNNDSIAFYVPC